MDHVLRSGLFKDKEVRQINYCRLYLQAITVSDITTASGSRLFAGINRGRTTEITSSTTWHHINQAKPDSASWSLWRKACELFSVNGILKEVLGAWLDPPMEQRRSWPTYYEPSTDSLLERSADKYEVHHRYKRRQTFHKTTTSVIIAAPPTSYPVDARPSQTGWYIPKLTRSRQPSKRPSQAHSKNTALHWTTGNRLSSLAFNLSGHPPTLWTFSPINHSEHVAMARQLPNTARLAGYWRYQTRLDSHLELDLLTATIPNRLGPKDKACLALSAFCHVYANG